ncbi:hypothetical protein Poli38472_004844 [Pythium oligandrum]|uniref:NADH:flavin oxidoreductase/NADH oxidase N-terminal domain-containing protein n=1 Tax=Pythium oligandrum TaxID=41045 RepID=A0A8K1FDU0_PYTOL|nr:hypothetical protein Poli38472_004844 [Pythium oligandrum]|eukprot:TMW59775.1 hypothetical protein Poli38472_004844 [Pythium oligandrum]
MSVSTPKLFTAITLGGKKDPIQLRHRIAMAPLTRFRADSSGVQPSYAAKYYQQRSTRGGLIIAEATNISPSGRGFFCTPGILTQEQIDAWKPVTKAVHEEDGYGGSVENRARFLFEVIEEILKEVDSSKLAVRLSPYSKTCAQQDSDPATTVKYVFEKLSDYNLAYAHIIEPCVFHYTNELTPKEGATVYFRQFYKGILVTTSGYERDSTIDVVEAGQADIVAIGRYFISNPDLVKRFELNAPLARFDEGTMYFYTAGETGYTDYPFLSDEEATS